MKFDGKIIVVTGGGSGIGRAMSLAFANEGGIVHVIDVDEKGAKEVCELIKSKGMEASFHKTNISNTQQVQQLIASITRIDVLINNAGIAHVGSVEDCQEHDFDKVYQVNVKGTYNMLRFTIPKMKNQKSGVVLNMASVASSIGIPDRFAYSMSKGAVVGITLSIARDYVSHGIRCNCISPGRVHTPFVDGFLSKNYPGQEKEMFEKLSATQPIGRMGTPDEIAKLALFLCSDDASFITGADYAIDGGFVNLKM
jgi:NAD(P)-dependent dehydrogenase (short-subunit alcohol dehydrogenase family)